RVSGHEVAEFLDDGAVLLGAHAAHARRRALLDVAQQAGAADLLRPTEHALGTAAYREHPEQQVQGLADRPGVGVRAKVADPLLLRPAHHLDPWILLVQRDREPGIALVVAVLDVEPRVELLDP